METTKKLIFDPNTMATTVGANSLNVEAIVSQPIDDHAELMIDGLDYVFDQAKYEECLSSSSSGIFSRLARARATMRKAQESKSGQTQLRSLDGARDSPNCLAQSARPRDTYNYLAGRETVSTVSPAARQCKLSRRPRDTSKCLAQEVFNRDSLECLAQMTFNRDTSKCLAQSSIISDTSDFPDQRSPSQLRPCTYPTVMSTMKLEKSTPVFNHFGPLPPNQGKAPVHERLGHARQQAGGYAPNPDAVQKCPEQAGTSQDSGIPVASRLSIPQGVRETIEGNNSKRARLNLPLNEEHPQKKTCPPIVKNVTLGGGGSTQQAVCRPDRPRCHAGGGNIRRRIIDQINYSCSCEQLIKVLQSGCACSESKSLLQRVSIFEGLSLPTAEELKPRRRRFRKGRSDIQTNEFSEVTINMVNKGKGAATAYSDPDFIALISQGGLSEDENSDSYSAIASDDTMSSVGRAREAFTITPETLAQILQEALARQKEELRAEMKAEMELAMQQIRELQNQKFARLDSSQQARPSHNATHDVDDSDMEENTIVNPSPKNTQSGEDTIHPAGGGNLKQNEGDSGRMKELESKVNALLSAQEVKQTGIPCPYPREWDLIPYPSKFNLIDFTPFDGKGSPTQHLIYFKSHLGVISGNEPLMIRSFVGTLRGAAFDWYRRLKVGSVNCWDDMESLFLSNFFDDDNDVSIGTLLDEKQKSGESIDAFIKRFRNKAVNCKDPITEDFILQTCHNNLSTDLLGVMRFVLPTSWKDLKIRGEQAERFLRRKKTERGKTTADPSEDASKSEFYGTYSFTDEEVPIIFKHLLDSNKIKLPPITNQEEADKTSDPKYCAYHRRVHHPTTSCFVLKDSIQALIDAGVLMTK